MSINSRLINMRNNQRGIGLVEVLVALLVFSVGMLGVASLQVLARKSSFEAQQRQEAVLLANEMVARMKASGQSLTEIGTSYGSFNTGAVTEPTEKCNLVTSNCVAADIAALDKYIWQQSIEATAITTTGQGLLKAKGCVVVESAVVKVVVVWESMSAMGTRETAHIPVDCRLADNKQRHVIIRTFL